MFIQLSQFAMDFLCLVIISNFVFIEATHIKVEEEEPEWSHDDQGAWCDISQMCCENKQSPVALGENETKKALVSMTPFKFINHEELPEEVTLSNDGNTVELEFESDRQPELEGGGLLDDYIFSNVHFHWGSSNCKGSEHTINGKRAPLEMHIVYFSSKFENITAAASSMKSDAIAVLAVLFHIDDDYVNPMLERITDRFEAVQFEGQSTIMKPINLLKLIPYKSQFYRYWGSLTTPPCSEVVVWTVFKEFMFLSSKQMQRFRSLCATPEDSSDCKRLVDNFRFIQPLNDRRVYKGQQSTPLYFYKWNIKN